MKILSDMRRGVGPRKHDGTGIAW